MSLLRPYSPNAAPTASTPSWAPHFLVGFLIGLPVAVVLVACSILVTP